MQLNQPPPPSPPPPPPPPQESVSIQDTIQGDPATRKFGLFFLGALALVTVGAGVGIGVGNLAHYRYFGPYNSTNNTNSTIYNQTYLRELSIEGSANLWMPLNERLRKRESSRKTRDSWSLFDKPKGNRLW